MNRTHARRLISNIKNHPAAGDGFGIMGLHAKDIEYDGEKGKDDIIAVAMTDDLDFDDEVVIPSGLDRGYIEKNRQVFVDHEYEIDKAAGFIRSVSAYPSTKDVRGFRVRIGLYDNPAANAVREIAQKSGQIGVSIGFKPLEVGPPTEEERQKYGDKIKRVIRRGSWFELSFTAIPCNVTCQGSIVAGSKAVREAMGKAGVSDEAAGVFHVPGQTVHITKTWTEGGIVWG